MSISSVMPKRVMAGLRTKAFSFRVFNILHNSSIEIDFMQKTYYNKINVNLVLRKSVQCI